MSPIDLTVRCMASRDGQVWVAVCLDFSLAAQGPSLDQARIRLHEQIRSYVLEAFSIDAQHAEVLLSRRAPWPDRLRYHWVKLLSQLKLQALVYREALPLQPAVA